jgi:hypothetical protein
MYPYLLRIEITFDSYMEYFDPIGITGLNEIEALFSNKSKESLLVVLRNTNINMLGMEACQKTVAEKCGPNTILMFQN